MKSKNMNKKSVGLGIIALMYLLAVLYRVDFHLSNLWFLTPGIWDMDGTNFWKAFFAELPFVFLRVAPIIVLLGVILLNIGLSARQYFRNRHAKRFAG